MINDPQKQCLVVYDWSTDISQKNLFSNLLEFASRSKLDIQTCSVELSGANRDRKMKIPDLLARLEKGEEVGSIELLMGEKRPGRNFNFDSDAYLRVASSADHRHCLIEMPPKLFADTDWEDLIFRLSHLGSLTYGACFNWRRLSSPAFHVVGISHSVAGPDGLVHVWPVSQDVKRLHKEEMLWRDERLSRVGSPAKMRHRLGYFRDVYEMNILNATHVDQIADGRKLGDIIRTTPGWGTLRELSNGNWLWTVDEVALGWIRQKFEQWKLLIRCL